jgi:hypothetical protein
MALAVGDRPEATPAGWTSPFWLSTAPPNDSRSFILFNPPPGLLVKVFPKKMMWGVDPD